MLTLADPKVKNVALRECGERFVDLTDYDSRIAVDLSRRYLSNRSPHFLKVRESIARRLVAASDALPGAVRLCVLEGYRPLAAQRDYFNRHLTKLRGAHPRLSDDALFVLASHYIAPPDVAAHPTGAAIDLRLIAAGSGEPLDLGCVPNATDMESSGGCYTHCAFIEPQAAHHRRLLVAAMRSAGFVNYPSEWWHWSYGDRYWAACERQPFAVYGPVDEAALEHDEPRPVRVPALHDGAGR
ncbi:M15 family metallopeptidase [Burkholderia alba]|uniref:M15 family metallopeptidase n=1 Tax=Burkholderia alba TaxID=2683677 RepID=UPI002B054CA4|nr:M15 family metallopeptidase [Burkholderia alba]